MAAKEKVGIVVSNKSEKTIVVIVQRRYQHPKYGKICLKSKRYMAHDEKNEAKSGDFVILQESAPFSRHKKWNLKKIIKIY
jgi:small subunit ribosomal protein S17